MAIPAVTNGTTTATTTAQPTGAIGKTSLNQVDFLNLFVAQLKFQDPMQPMDNYQMASQMAQFSLVEGMNKMSESLKNMEASQLAANNLQAASIVGKTVEVKGNGLTIKDGKVSEGFYQLEKPGRVAINIFDTRGGLVRTLELGAQDTTKQKLVWDGKNLAGAALPDGEYSFRVTALDEKDQSINVTTTMTGKVDGVSFDSTGTLLRIGSKQVLLSEIIAILA
ncbi:MAG: flagellar hook assembly protein FlgD [Deltaproteobacteria bacterium]|nr:flagellar hook assembly protein FlgD [Deltaproteobacteria bacterium]